jgi:hypothetical protein
MFILILFITKPKKEIFDKLLYQGVFKKIKKNLSERIFGTKFNDYILFSLYRERLSSSVHNYGQNLYLGFLGITINLTELLQILSGILLILFLLILIIRAACNIKSFNSFLYEKFEVVIFSIILYLSIVPNLEIKIGSSDFLVYLVIHFIVIQAIFYLYSHWSGRYLNSLNYMVSWIRAYSFSCLGYLAYLASETEINDRSRFSTKSLWNNLISPGYHGNKEYFAWLTFEIQYSQITLASILLLIMFGDWTSLSGIVLGISYAYISSLTENT